MLLAVAVATVAYVVARPRGGHEYRVVFTTAGQLVEGDLVRIGGTRAGTVRRVALTAADRAEVRIRLDRGRPALRRGTTAVIRAQGLTGVASRYVDVTPAPAYRPALDDGATIGADRTRSIVEVDQLLDALDEPTRAGIRRVVDGSADWYAGREEQAGRAAQYLSPALAQLAALERELTRDSGTLTDFLVEVGDAMGALAARRAQLTSLVSGARATAGALSADTASLERALADLPPALRGGARAMADLRQALGDVRRLVGASAAPARVLPAFLSQLTGVLDVATPAFARLRAMFARPGAGDDLRDALAAAPAVARLTRTTFPHAERALDRSTPVFRFARPYVPDLVGWATGFGAVTAPYDANGHYARTLPVFHAFTFADDAEGGRLIPAPFPARGRSDALSTGNLRRCPGAAGPLPDDGSAPFVDSGPEANPDCDPAQVVGGRR